MPSDLIHKYMRIDHLPHIWCAGCGNGILMRDVAVAIDRLGLDREKVVIVSGIGCSSRAAGYMDFNTIHTTHGRAIAFATGIKMANPELEMVYPEEGLGFGIMAAFIPAQAPNVDAAYAFLDYINTPENAAKCFEYIGYYCTNKAADALISEEMKRFVVLPEGAAEGEIIQNVSREAEDLHAEIWNQFKNACD